MKNNVISLERIKQTHIDALEDRLRSNSNKLTDAMNTIIEQEIQLQMMDDMISQMMEQTIVVVNEMQQEIDDLKKLVYELENKDE